ncbi:MAG: nucleotidyltransferase domain-containing protein [Methylococcales bacterium]|nr:nucleotidyltransferase domain-containing protein [Methylococcales bacterium]MDD5754047.1 nucleotidyltransferase domain-containing protein [Methylococcales bacterium]
MRLTEKQQTIIRAACEQHFSDGKCWLFGSRVDDNKRGGDIDLYIETSEADVTNVVNAKLAFLVTLTRQLGEQKIDVVVHRANSELLPIHQIAKQTGILL